MVKSKDIEKSKADMQQIAGMIARMPSVDPPSDLTDAVMKRITPKKITPRQIWLRRLNTYWSTLPVPAMAMGMAVALILGSLIVIKGYQFNSDILQVNTNPLGTGTGQVAFILDLPSAHNVAVIGSFNQWNPEGYAMHRASQDGKWILSLRLERGKYTYAFLIDGQQVIADPHSLWQQDDGFGNFNSSIIVENGKQNANTI